MLKYRPCLHLFFPLIAIILFSSTSYSTHSSNSIKDEKKLRFLDSPTLQTNNDYIKNPHPKNNNIPKSLSGIVSDIKKTHRDLHHIIQR